MGSSRKGSQNTAPSSSWRVGRLMSYSLTLHQCLRGGLLSLINSLPVSSRFTLQHRPRNEGCVPLSPSSLWAPRRSFPVRALEGSAGARGWPAVRSACGQEDRWGGPWPRREKGQSPSNPAAVAWSRVGFQWPCQHTPCGPPAACHAPTLVSMGFSPWCSQCPPDGDATCSVPAALTLPLCLHTGMPGHQQRF